MNIFNICLTDSSVVPFLFDHYLQQFLKWYSFHSCHFLSKRVFWSKNESHCEKEFPIKAASGFDLQLFVLIPSLTQQVMTVLNFLSLAKWTWLYLLVGNSKQAAAWMGLRLQTCSFGDSLGTAWIKKRKKEKLLKFVLKNGGFDL